MDASPTVVETATGKVEGAYESGVHSFKGIPYGQSTAGANRFLRAKKPTPWKGIRPAKSYGHLAMQPMPDGGIYSVGDIAEFNSGANPEWERDGRSEDCLVLNVWTAGLNGKRPVVVHLHGGGFWFGTGAAKMTDGTNLARDEDVVFVDSNHRLNIFGYLHLGDIAPDAFPESGNCGLLDIVAMLQWIRDNIAQFGGDPNNVTIVGDSGGGSKVGCLMAVPEARGLFHRAAIFSGGTSFIVTRDEATQTAISVLNYLGIQRLRVADLQSVPAERVLDAMLAVAANSDIALTTRRNGRWFHMFAPVLDGRVLSQHPFYPQAAECSSQVPLLIGTVRDETTVIFGDDAAAFSLSEPQMSERLVQILGLDNGDLERLLSIYRAKLPAASPSDLFFRISSDIGFRIPQIRIAEAKAAQAKAPCYMYLFEWECQPFRKFGAGHGVELPFFFKTLDAAPGICRSPVDPRDAALERNISKALAAFARTGSPNHKDLPEWKAYDVSSRSTMVINRRCELVNDPQDAERNAIQSLSKMY